MWATRIQLSVASTVAKKYGSCCVVAVARKGALRQRILPAPTNRRFHNIVAEQSSHISRRQFGAISGTQTTRSKSSDVDDDHPPGISSQDQHSLFHQQMQELDSELNSFSVGTESPPPMEDDLQSSFQTNKEMIKDKWMEDEMEDLKREREELYGFTAEEKNAWGTNASGHVHPAEWMQQIDEARQDREQKIKAAMTAIETENEGESSQYVETTNTPPIEQTSLSSKESDSNQLFTHVSASGNSISMVNVGHKVVSQRMARARTKVIFPPEVMDAFSISSNNNEMVGPKGPIFATAQLAGIMGAKRTSDLIPLCHPLPLDKVHVDIRLEGNIAIVECECHVTHKTGVEMEALMGSSIAALTIYDMVKAVSHKVKIQETVLVSKRGGKRTIDEEQVET